MEQKMITAIEKFRYVYKFLKTGEGDKDLAMKYVQELGQDLDDYQAKIVVPSQCGPVPTIPGP